MNIVTFLKHKSNKQVRENQIGEYGARYYDELSGRFLSVDTLWVMQRLYTQDLKNDVELNI